MKIKKILTALLLVILTVGVAFSLPARDPNLKTYSLTIPPFENKGYIVPVVEGAQQPATTEVGAILSSTTGVKIDISNISLSGTNWNLTCKITGNLRAYNKRGYTDYESRAISLLINDRTAYIDGGIGDYANYATNEYYYNFGGGTRTLSIPVNALNPMQLIFKVTGSAYHTSTHTSYNNQSAYVSMNTSHVIDLNNNPQMQYTLDKNYINGKDSTSMIVSGKAWDVDGDSFTVTASVNGKTKSQSFLNNSVTQMPSSNNFSFTFDQSEVADFAGTMSINVVDYYSGTQSNTQTVYIDRVVPIVRVDNILSLKPNENAIVYSNDYGTVYLLENDRAYPLYQDVLNAVAQNKGASIGVASPNVTQYFSVPNTFSGTYRAYLVDRAKNVSPASTAPIYIDSTTPQLLKIVIEDNKIKLIYDEPLAQAPVADDFLINKSSSTASDITIVAGEEFVNYEFVFDDFEKDTKNADRFLFTAFDNSMFTNTNGVPDIVGDKPTSNTKFTQVGRYSLEYSAQDKPSADPKFLNYYKWSNKTDINLLVHRRPLAKITCDVAPRTLDGKWTQTNIIGSGSDLDHTDMSNLGIVAEKWEWKLENEGVFVTGTLPAANLRTFQTSTGTYSNYIVRYTTQDVEGAWSLPAYQTVTLTGSAPITISTVLNPAFPNPVVTGNTFAVESTVNSPLPVTSVTGKLNGVKLVNMTKISQVGNISKWTYNYLADSSFAVGTYDFVTVATNNVGTTATDTDKVQIVNSAIITGVRVWGDWNHWRGQLDKVTKQTLVSNPHRFLTHENIHIEADLLGNPDSVTVDMAPQLVDYTYTNKQGITYRHESFGYPLKVHPLIMTSTDNKEFKTSYVIPLCDWTLGYDNIRRRAAYTITVTAKKSATVVTYTISDIEITGNIHDTTYLAPGK